MQLLVRLALAAALIAGGAPTRAQTQSEVAIDNFVFTPAHLTVKAGTKVTFVNHDDLPHNVRDEAGAFHSPALDTDETFTHVFDKPGEFAYFCGLHPQMRGKITVTP